METKVTINIQDIIETLAVSYETMTHDQFREVLTTVKVIVNDDATWEQIISAVKAKVAKYLGVK